MRSRWRGDESAGAAAREKAKGQKLKAKNEMKRADFGFIAQVQIVPD
jgi:hypothetical protein